MFSLHDSKTCRTCVGSQSSKSYTFDSSGANLTPYHGVIFSGSYFNSKKEFEELFFRSKSDPRYRGVKITPKKGVILYLKVLLYFQS